MHVTVEFDETVVCAVDFSRHGIIRRWRLGRPEVCTKYHRCEIDCNAQSANCSGSEVPVAISLTISLNAHAPLFVLELLGEIATEVHVLGGCQLWL